MVNVPSFLSFPCSSVTDRMKPCVLEPGDAGNQALLRLHHDERATLTRPIYRDDRQSNPEDL
jgi:hypothetical protein